MTPINDLGLRSMHFEANSTSVELAVVVGTEREHVANVIRTSERQSNRLDVAHLGERAAPTG